MDITIKINTDNDAFQDGRNGALEIERILGQTANGLVIRDYLLTYENRQPLRDVNGNVCGYIEISKSED